MKIAIFTDSGSNFYQEQPINIPLPDVFVSCLQIIDKDKGYKDGLELTSEKAYELLEAGKMLKTSSPTAYDIEQNLIEIKQKGYDTVFAIVITSGLSSTLSTVSVLAQQNGLNFEAFDCGSTANIQYECVLKAQQMLNEHQSLEAIKDKLSEMCEQSITFVVPIDMQHLVRGGRLSPLAATFANFLKISPILYLNQSTQGKIEPFKKVRTLKKAFDTMVQHFVSLGLDANYKICVAHVKAKENATLLIQMIKEAIPQIDIYLTDLVAVVGAHTGLGTVACTLVKKQ